MSFRIDQDPERPADDGCQDDARFESWLIEAAFAEDDPLSDPETLRAHLGSFGLSGPRAEHIVRQRQRLAVYRLLSRNAIAGPTMALFSSTYAVMTRVRAGAFESWLRTWIESIGPRTGLLRQAPVAWARWLLRRRPPALPNWVADLLRYELAEHLSETRISKRPRAPDEGEIAPDDRVWMHPSVQLLSSSWPVDDPDAVLRALDCDPDAEPVHLLVYRDVGAIDQGDVRTLRVASGTLAALRALRRGESLRSAIAPLASATPGPGARTDDAQLARLGETLEQLESVGALAPMRSG